MLTHPNTAPLTDWVDREEMAQGQVAAPTAAMIQATIMPAPRPLEEGDELPALWHWYAFPPCTPMTELGRDGHPKVGGFLPPVPLERRMWAGGKLSFHQPLHVGEPITRRSRIASVTQKDGAAGPMVFVSVVHDMSGSDGLAVRERQDIVYLNIPQQFTPPPKRPAPVLGVVIDTPVPVSAALLFRYSAITFNAHRIHYDLAYARDVEKYPDLVVHGPLQANLLLQAATDHAGRTPTGFSFRGVHPLFCTSGLSLRGWEGEQGALEMCTAADAGHQGMIATATWEET